MERGSKSYIDDVSNHCYGTRKANNCNRETYFSIQIELRVGGQDERQSRSVVVFIRCAKALSKENKQVHIIPHRKEDDLPFFTIDIAREDFPEPTIEDVYPGSITDGNVSKGEQRRYSKILFDAVSFLREVGGCLRAWVSVW